MACSWLAVAACSYSPTAVPGDGPVEGPPCQLVWPYAPTNLGSCGEPTGAFDIDNGDFEYNPDGGILEQLPGQIIGMFSTTGGTPTRVLVVNSFHVGPNATLRIIGLDALIIAVDGSASIEGTITVAATGTLSGAGAADCAGTAGADAAGLPVPKSGGGGGGGGGFGSIGSDGGTGDVKAGFPRTLGGMASGIAGDELLSPLRGGCPGGHGGQPHPTAKAVPGAGGGGGGAIQISVRDDLVLAASATIQAGGGGGGGVDNQMTGDGTHVGGGGGGGGSGGAIFLEAGTFTAEPTATVQLCANGGGGGAGSHEATENQPGADAACDDVPAMGGAGDNSAGAGGRGAFIGASSAGSQGNGEDGGGGGGGGGAGRIRVHVITSPPASVSSSPTARIE